MPTEPTHTATPADPGVHAAAQQFAIQPTFGGYSAQERAAAQHALETALGAAASAIQQVQHAHRRIAARTPVHDGWNTGDTANDFAAHLDTAGRAVRAAIAVNPHRATR